MAVVGDRAARMDAGAADERRDAARAAAANCSDGRRRRDMAIVVLRTRSFARCDKRGRSGKVEI